MTSAGSAEGPSPLTLGGGRRAGPSLRRSETWAVWALMLLLFGHHLAFGGGRREVALVFSAGAGLLLFAFAATNWGRAAFERVRPLRTPAIVFGLVLFAAGWSLTPWTPGGPHPVWTYVEGWPAPVLDRGAVLVEVLSLLSLACVFLAGWAIGGSDDRARLFFTLTAWAIAAYAVWAFVSHLIDPETIYGFVPKSTSDRRLNGSFFSANTTASFLAMGAVLLTANLLDRLRGFGEPGAFGWERVVRRGGLRLAALAFCLAALVLTASRAGVTAGAVALMAFVVWEAVARRWRLLGPAGIALTATLALLLALLLVGGSNLFERLLNASADAEARSVINTAHWDAFLASPWLGYGLGSFSDVNRLIATPETFETLWNVRATHNVYLQWLEEAGLVGAVPMFLCVVALLGSIVAGSLRRRRMTTWLRAVVCASLVLLIHGLTDFALQIPSISAQWAALLGVAMGVGASRGRAA